MLDFVQGPLIERLSDDTTGSRVAEYFCAHVLVQCVGLFSCRPSDSSNEAHHPLVFRYVSFLLNILVRRQFDSCDLLLETVCCCLALGLFNNIKSEESENEKF